ncbi:hypothetical protein C8J56DRAFT_1058302 [Mycena floridula]|nr:hypothetical protein C8J56DRAFT_1058302 [Mycena floridula]
MSTLQHRRLPQPVPDIDFAPWGLRGEDPFMDMDADGQALFLSQEIGAAVQALPLPIIRTRNPPASTQPIQGDLNLQDRYPHLPPELCVQLASVAAHPAPRGQGHGHTATVNNAQAGSSQGHSHGTVSNAEPGPSQVCGQPRLDTSPTRLGWVGQPQLDTSPIPICPVVGRPRIPSCSWSPPPALKNGPDGGFEPP